jgi:hypothetical protein
MEILIVEKFNFNITNSHLIEKIEGRKALFLDSNIWINIADENSSLASKIKNRLIKLVEKGVVFCPISMPIISELYKQNFESAYQGGKLMEKLSLNLCYKHNNEVFRNEVINFIKSIFKKQKLQLTNEFILCPIVGYLSSNYTLSFPESFSNYQIDENSEAMKQYLDDMTLTEMLKLRKSNFPFKNETNLLSFKEQNEKRHKFTKGNKTKMRRIEEEYVANSIILPLIMKISTQLTTEQIVTVWNYIESLPKDKYGGYIKSILDYLPALKSFVEIMTITGYDINRKDSTNDFFDRELMIIPLAYADVLIAEDKWIRDLLNNVSTYVKNNKITYLSTMEEFEQYLFSLAY